MQDNHCKFRAVYTLDRFRAGLKKEDYMQRMKEEICSDFIRNNNVSEFSVEFHEESFDDYETYVDTEQFQREDGQYVFKGRFISREELYQLSKKYSRKLIANIKYV